MTGDRRGTAEVEAVAAIARAGAEAGTEAAEAPPPRAGTEGVAEAGTEAVDSVFAALADPTRRRVLDLLAAKGEATATALAEQLPVSRQAVVKHLTVLAAAGLVSSSRVGREVRYAVRSEALDSAARWMAALAADWDRRLARIKRIAEAAERDFR